MKSGINVSNSDPLKPDKNDSLGSMIPINWNIESNDNLHVKQKPESEFDVVIAVHSLLRYRLGTAASNSSAQKQQHQFEDYSLGYHQPPTRYCRFKLNQKTSN
jgi:hypothetical protein